MKLQDLMKADGLLGYGTLELLDERGRKVLERVPFENFIGLHAQEELKSLLTYYTSMYTFLNAYPTVTHTPYVALTSVNNAEYGSGTKKNGITSNPFGGVYLSDSDAAEVAGTERLVPGTILGTGIKRNLSPTGNRAGIVQASTSATEFGATHRWEWTTGQANGDIKSIGWCDFASWCDDHDAANGHFDFAEAPFECRLGPANSGDSTYWNHAIRASDGRTYTAYNGSLYYAAPNPWAGGRRYFRTVDSVTNLPFYSPTLVGAFTGTEGVADICFDDTNGYIWYSKSASTYNIKSVNPTTPGTPIHNFTPGGSPSVAQFVACDGTNVYHCSPVATGTASVVIYKIPIATGTPATLVTHTLNAAPSTVASGANNMVLGLFWAKQSGMLGIVESAGIGSQANAGNARQWVTLYTSAGVKFGTVGLNNTKMWNSTTGNPYNPISNMASGTYPHGFEEYDGFLHSHYAGPFSGSGSVYYQHLVYKMSNLASRTKLGATVTKTVANALRLDYTLTIV